jgi:type I restriction enzyme S subunit
MTQKVKLSDLFKIGSSKRVLKSQWQKSGVPFYRGREVTKLSMSGLVDNDLFITEELYTEYAKKYGVPSAGDIVITAIGTIGNSYIVREEDRFYFKDASVLWLKRTSDVESKYINLWLKSPLMKEQLDEGNGATVDTLTIKKLQSLTVDLPPLPEQKRIVALLDDVFVDLEQTRAKTEQNLKNSRELFDNYLQQTFTKKGDGWLETTLGELCEKMEYGTSSKSQPDGDIPVLRMGNIQGGELDWEKLKYTSNESDIDKLLLNENDVLFNRTNSPELVGKSAIYRNERPAVFAGYLIRIHRKKDLLDANYLNYYLNSNFARTYGFSVMSHSTNQANINGTKLKSYPINIPDISEQLILGNSFRELKSEIKKVENIYKNKLLKIEELKKSILQKAFTGKLTTTAK